MQFKGYELNPFQVQAAQALRAGKNVLVAAPTGSGKTLVAEYAIEDAVAQGRRVIYTSPIKALSNQKYRDFRADGLEVGLMTGDLTLKADAPLLIMTTEIFRNSVFENPERFDDVDFAIFDEIHFLDDIERGTVWEESLIFAPEHVRFVGLSATISNLAQFGKWIASVRQHELEIVRHDRRPVPLEQQLFHPASGMFKLAQRRRALQSAARAAKETPRGGRLSGRPGRRMQRRRRGQPHPSAMVLDELEGKDLMPALFFCFSRKECEIKADRNQNRELLTRAERRRMQELFDDICDQFEIDKDRDPAVRAILNRALQGLGFHHAGMLPIHKEIVERLFTSGLLKLLFTTETFALGINMPARTVVFDSLRKFDGVSFDYMRARDYMQMAGRAGRQGLDKSGLVISILDDEALQDAPLTDLFNGKVEPITSRFNLSYSTTMNLYERIGEDLVGAYDKSFASFQSQTGSQKSRERKRSKARAALRTRLAILEDAGYIDADGLLPRGRIAKRINGYEIQTTELLLDGILDELDTHQLAAVFVALVYEARRGTGEPPARAALSAKQQRSIFAAIDRFAAIEASYGFRETIKVPDFGLTSAVVAWAEGCTVRQMEHKAGRDAGDVVRSMRMAIMMMRQLRSTLDGDYALIDRLQESIVSINRDVVDAKRQFELG